MPNEQPPVTPVTPPTPKFTTMFSDNMGFNTPPGKPAEAGSPAAPVVKPPDQPAGSKPALPTIGTAPANPPAKPAEVKQTEEMLTDEPPPNLSPKSAESWNQFKQKANERIKAESEFRTKYETAQKELEALKKAPGQKGELPPEFEALKKEHEEVSNELKRTNLERHPAFKKHFETKFNSAVDLAKDALGKDSEYAATIAKILKSGDSDKLEEIAGELSPMKAGQLSNAATQYRSAEQERERLLSQAESELQAFEATAQQSQEKQREGIQKRTQEVTNRALELATTLDAFTEKEGDVEHNKNVLLNKQFVKDFYAGTAKDELVQWAPALAAEALHLKKVTIPSLESEIKKRDDIIAKYTGGTPRLNGGGGGGGGGGGEKKTFTSVWNASTGG